MSRQDYEECTRVYFENPSFRALIMTAMRKADPVNIAKLRREWLEVWKELQQRSNAPGGFLDTEEMEEGLH